MPNAPLVCRCVSLCCRDAKFWVVAASLAVVHTGPHTSCHNAPHPPIKTQSISERETRSRRVPYVHMFKAHKERKEGTCMDKWSARWCKNPPFYLQTLFIVQSLSAPVLVENATRGLLSNLWLLWSCFPAALNKIANSRYFAKLFVLSSAVTASPCPPRVSNSSSPIPCWCVPAVRIHFSRCGQRRLVASLA